MESLLNTWSIPLLQLFLESRNVNISESSKQDQKALQDLVSKSSKMPIVPRSRTPSSIFDILTLPQLVYYLKQKRGHPVNANAAWLRFAPPKLGRVKRDALRDFALKEYETIIASNEKELDQFDQDIADTLQQEIIIVQATPKDGKEDESASVFGIYLLDDDIDVLYETWGIERDPKWSREEALMQAQKTGTFLVSGEVS